MNITTHSPEEAAEVIYNVLSSRRFEKWYGGSGPFEGHICGESDCKSKEEIVNDIKNIFSITQ